MFSEAGGKLPDKSEPKQKLKMFFSVHHLYQDVTSVNYTFSVTSDLLLFLVVVPVFANSLYLSDLAGKKEQNKKHSLSLSPPLT